MRKKTETIHRIDKCYVSKDCVQVMLPYKDSITIFNKNGIMYHHLEDSSFFINNYINDERRKQFPYHNIPTHYSKSKFGGKIHKTNQLFNFEQPYIRITGGNIIESFVVRDNDEALLINKTISILDIEKTELKTRKEVENLLNPPTNISVERYFVSLDGGIRKDNKIELPTEERIYEKTRESLLTNVEDFKKYIKNNPSSTVGSYLHENPLFLEFVEKNAKSSDLKDFTLNIPLIRDNLIILVKTNHSEITLQGINIHFIKSDCYKVDVFDIPITKYTLEQIKYLASEIIPMKEPNISLKLNPGITKEELYRAKQMVYNRN